MIATKLLQNEKCALSVSWGGGVEPPQWLVCISPSLSRHGMSGKRSAFPQVHSLRQRLPDKLLNVTSTDRCWQKQVSFCQAIARIVSGGGVLTSTLARLYPPSNCFIRCMSSGDNLRVAPDRAFHSKMFDPGRNM